MENSLNTARPGVGGLIPGPVRIGPIRDQGGLREVWAQPLWLVRDRWTNPAAADIDAYIGTPLAAGNTTTLTVVPGDAAFDGIIPTGVADFARNVVITVTHATSVVVLSGVITGKDIHGNTVTEAWSVAATGTTKTFTGAVAFKSITSITIVSAADATANSVVAGTGKVFGLSFKSAYATRIVEKAAGSIVTNGVIVAASTSANADDYGTYTPNGTPNAVDDYELVYVTDDPTDI